MAREQQRWFCDLCKREWLHLSEETAVGVPKWDPAEGCPGCHSPRIREIRFVAEFYGGDIPRDENDNPINTLAPVPTKKVDADTPPLTLVARR